MDDYFKGAVLQLLERAGHLNTRVPRDLAREFHTLVAACQAEVARVTGNLRFLLDEPALGFTGLEAHRAFDDLHPSEPERGFIRGGVVAEVNAFIPWSLRNRHRWSGVIVASSALPMALACAASSKPGTSSSRNGVRCPSAYAVVATRPPMNRPR